MLDIVHPMPKGLTHVRDRAGKKSDLIGAGWQSRDLHLASAT